MQRFDSGKLLEERARMFEKHFGQNRMDDEGKVLFPSLPGRCTLSYASRKSLTNRNYFLSLQAEIPIEGDSDSGSGQCYLNRLGGWRLKGKNTILRGLCERIKESEAISSQLKKADWDTIILRAEQGSITLSMNLYGGGFSAMMLPPMQFKVGISEEQINYSAALFKTLVSEIGGKLKG